MARLILKSPYIKSTGGASGYLRYIATRERVELIPDDRPPTRKQEQLIAKLVKDFPDSKTLYEYEDYLTKTHQGQRLCVHHAGAGSQLGCHPRVGTVHEVCRHPSSRGAHRRSRFVR
mgnify:CR=1 FL=1